MRAHSRDFYFQMTFFLRVYDDRNVIVRRRRTLAMQTDDRYDHSPGVYVPRDVCSTLNHFNIRTVNASDVLDRSVYHRPRSEFLFRIKRMYIYGLLSRDARSRDRRRVEHDRPILDRPQTVE